jgi:Gpi18-like mannosyltransferase
MSRQEQIILVSGALLAIALRMFFINFESQDYVLFLSPWYQYMQANGAFHAFHSWFSNYSPLYLHLLSITTSLPLNSLYVIKAWSILFDFVGAYFAYRILERAHPQSLIPALGSVSVLLIPTVVLNSSAWGQCDMVVASFLLGAIYYLLERRFHLSFILLGIAMALKPQAFFILPIFFLGWLRKQYSWRYFIYLPLVYVLTCVPSLLAGRHIKDLLLIYYANAVGRYLSAGIPNFYDWFPSAMQHFEFWNRLGLLLAMAVIGAACLIVYLRFRGRDLPDGVTIQLALFCALAAPFFLPQMHDRYYFLADVISVIYFFFFVRNVFVPLIVVAGSLIAYLNYLYGMQPIDFLYPSIAIFLVLSFLFIGIVRSPAAPHQ